MRGVARAGREVQEERLVGVDRPQVPEELDRPVGQVVGEVIAVLDRRGRPHRMVVVIERGHELVRLTAVEAVPAVDPRASGQVAREAAMLVSSSGDRCHFPTA